MNILLVAIHSNPRPIFTKLFQSFKHVSILPQNNSILFYHRHLIQFCGLFPGIWNSILPSNQFTPHSWKFCHSFLNSGETSQFIPSIDRFVLLLKPVLQSIQGFWNFVLAILVQKSMLFYNLSENIARKMISPITVSVIPRIEL